MKTILFTLLYIIPGSVSSFAQKHEQKVYSLFNRADSIVIVSHLTTYIPIVDEITKQSLGFRKLVINKKPVYSIIKESITLDKNAIDTLVKILLTSNRDIIIEDYKCFIPHHGILIFKKGKVSFFDICFTCNHFETSKNIKLSDELSLKSWQDLELFFKKRNMKYEMPEYNYKEENEEPNQ